METPFPAALQNLPTEVDLKKRTALYTLPIHQESVGKPFRTV